MKKHKVILEVEVYVEDGGDVTRCAEEVVSGIEEHIGYSSDCDPPRVDGIRVVSVDKEPLPPTEEELEEAREKALVDAFLAKTALGTFVTINHFWRVGLLSAFTPDTVSVVDRFGVTRSCFRHEIYTISEGQLHCGHGHSRMDTTDCVECNTNARMCIEGVFKRDVM